MFVSARDVSPDSGRVLDCLRAAGAVKRSSIDMCKGYWYIGGDWVYELPLRDVVGLNS